ncbi:MAG: hypothetical protein OXH75_29680 [Acidobacteria bacterium]|nr:hypothetical protein [Acidobacteriota bacterium]
MPPIVIVDTSVLLNVLDVPGFNQDRATVLGRFGELVEAAANLLLPMGAVFETGNHIAQLPDGQRRRRYAEVFRDRVREALAGRAPWTLVPGPDATQLAESLDSFPEYAMQGVGMVDLAIVKAWERACARHPRRHVSIWSLDHHLAGHDQRPHG